jgi:hypothetical protein
LGSADAIDISNEDIIGVNITPAWKWYGPAIDNDIIESTVRIKGKISNLGTASDTLENVVSDSVTLSEFAAEIYYNEYTSYKHFRLKGIEVKLVDKAMAIADINGNYTMPYVIDKGTYKVHVKQTGYQEVI